MSQSRKATRPSGRGLEAGSPRAPFPLPNPCGPSPVPVGATGEIDEAIIQVFFDLPLLDNVGFDMDGAFWSVTKSPVPANVTQVTILASNLIQVSLDSTFGVGSTCTISYDGLDPALTYSGGCPLAAFTDFEVTIT